LILDLRGDPGGIVTESRDIANMFLQQGQQIASVKGREGPAEVDVARATPIAPSQLAQELHLPLKLS
jgi:C-terminal processing protease CtpA/Prc